MINLVDKNILICCNLKAERLLFFNFFDAHESKMIYTAKDLEACKEILQTEKIDIIILECSQMFIHTANQLKQLMHKYPATKVVVLINKSVELTDQLYQGLKTHADRVLFEPLSQLEVETKLAEICLDENKATAKTEQFKESVDEDDAEASEELWNLFFDDSPQAKLIVTATDQTITKVNDSFGDLLGKKASSFIGKSWQLLDDKSNHANYIHYLKEINSGDKTVFMIKNKQGGSVRNLTAQYQLGVLNGEIVYLGELTPENMMGVSNEVYEDFNKIHKIDTFSNEFPQLLEDLRRSLDFSFVLFFECQNDKILKPIIAGDVQTVHNFLKRSFEPLCRVINNSVSIEVDRNNDRASEYSEILNANSLHSLCVYPISHQNKVYGTIVAAGLNQIDNWQTISVVLRSLAHQCRFNLFQKTIINQRELEGQIDQLTGLPNRNAMTHRFAQIIEEGISSDKYIALMIIDIEKLNYLNKNIGIELTDEIIVSVSRIITQCIRNKGLVYRLTGDEFLVLLHPHTDKKFVEFKVEELIAKLNHSILLSNGEDVDISFNIGISIFPDDGQTVASMMKNADLAMYDAKLAGKNNYVVFKHSETGQALKQKTEMEDNLKKAIDEGHIKVFFQPKINALTEDIIGFEALVRWIDPEIGMINPGHFIPLAEETGLINKIGEYVTAHSCKMIVEWQKKYGLALFCSINLSAVQLIDAQLPKKLEAIINSSGVHPYYIDFEITETISLDVVPNLVESLNEIVEFGCTLSIDDFGTGHSSLDYIKKIPAKFIKIDQSFVRNIGLNPEDEAILDATINIAKRLNRQIIAEGVETEEQREYLLDRECEYFQGYLFARPMPQDEIEELLRQRVKLMGTN